MTGSAPGRRPADEDALRTDVRALLDDDSFPHAGALLRSRPALLTAAVERILDELAADGATGYRRPLVDQVRAFLRRCRQEGLEAVFPPGRAEIDPTTVAAVYADMTAADTAEATFLRTGERAELRAAGEAWLRVVRTPALRSAHPALPAALRNNAGAVLLRRYWELGDVDDLTSAIELFDAASALTPPGSVSWVRRQGNLARAMREVYQRTRSPVALEKAVAVATGAASAADAIPGPAPAEALLTFALLLGDRWRRTAGPDDLAAAIAAAGRAVARADSVNARATLGNLLLQRSEAGGDVDDLQQAVTLLTTAAETTPVTDPDHPRRLMDRSIALLARHRRLGDSADVALAVSLCADAVAAMAPTSPDRPACLAQQANALYQSYVAAGRLADLQDATTAATEAIDTASPTEVAMTGWQVNLGTFYQARWLRSDDIRDIGRAIALFQAAADRATESSDRYATFNNLGNALRERGVVAGDRDDLDQAVANLRVALSLADPGTTRAATAETNLAAALRDRSLVADDPNTAGNDLDEALGLLTRLAPTVSDTDPDGPRMLFTLARTARARANRRRHTDPAGADDDERAVAAYYRACDHGVLTDPESTLLATMEWGAWATARRAWPEAADAYGGAVAALTALLERQLVRSHREEWLRVANGLAGPVAYATAAAHRPVQALLAAERTRALLLSEALGRSQARLDLLAAARPELAECYVRAAHRLALAEYAGSGSGAGRGLPGTVTGS